MPPRTLIIGDRLNTSSLAVRAAAARCDLPALAALATRQLDGGADALDICACSSGPDELAHCRTVVAAIMTAQSGCTLSIDTQSAGILESVRRELRIPPILNCHSGQLDCPGEMLVAIEAARPVEAVVALCLDGFGPRAAPAIRLRCAERLMHDLCAAGIEPRRIIFDPITLPKSTGRRAEAASLETMSLLRREFSASGVLCAVSNYSFGMTRRRDAERAYAARARDAGATCFLLDARDAALCRIARGNPSP